MVGYCTAQICTLRSSSSLEARTSSNVTRSMFDEMFAMCCRGGSLIGECGVDLFDHLPPESDRFHQARTHDLYEDGLRPVRDSQPGSGIGCIRTHRERNMSMQYSHPVRESQPTSDSDRSTAWRLQAACRFFGPGPFFAPDGETPAARARREREAKQVCSHCPVVTQCLRYCIRMAVPFGIWGGTSERERIRRGRSSTVGDQ